MTITEEEEEKDKRVGRTYGRVPYFNGSYFDGEILQQKERLGTYYEKHDDSPGRPVMFMTNNGKSSFPNNS